jgi:cytochrome c oxidase subunit 2
VIRRILAACLTVTLAACESDRSMLAPRSPQATSIEQLWWLLFWVCTAGLVLTMLALLIGLARRRSAAVPAGEERGVAIAVGTGLGVAFIVIVVFLVASLRSGVALVGPHGFHRPAAAQVEEGALEIELVGRQWWWEVKYPDTDPSRSVTTANEIHVPVGRPIHFKLRAVDVIHSFWLPNLHGKMDLVPSRDSSIRFTVQEPGEFHGQCAEFCGAQHANMRFLLIAHEPAEFAAWLDEQRALPSPPTDGPAKRGQQVFTSGRCAMCHSIQGSSAGGRQAPDLTHLASRRTIAAGLLANTTGNRAGWIVDPQRIKPGAKMPANYLSSDDLQALLAYLETLR